MRSRTAFTDRGYVIQTFHPMRQLISVLIGFAALAVLFGLLGWGVDVDLLAQEEDAAVQAALREADTLPVRERRAYAAGVRAAFIAARDTRDGKALAAICQASQAQGATP